jgi:hypothetical protein
MTRPIKCKARDQGNSNVTGRARNGEWGIAGLPQPKWPWLHRIAQIPQTVERGAIACAARRHYMATLLQQKSDIFVNTRLIRLSKKNGDR